MPKIHSFVWLVLLNFFLVTAVFPAIAHPTDLRAAILDFRFKATDEKPNLAKTGNLTNQPKSSDAKTLLEQGRSLYEAKRFSEAATVWETAASGFEAMGDRLQYAQSLLYLSIVYQNLGQFEQAKVAIASSLHILQTQQKLDRQGLAILAQALNAQGSLQLAMGQSEAALNTWKQAQLTYSQAGDELGQLGSQINQAQALQALGLYRRAKTNLEQVNKKLLSLPDSVLKATGLQSLGEALQVLGDLPQAQEILKQSLAIAVKLNSDQAISAALFSLGNNARSSGDTKAALDFYQQAAAIAPNVIAKLEALLNQLSLSIEIQQWQTVQLLLPQIKSELANLTPSRSAVYAQVNLAENLLKLENLSAQSSAVNQGKIKPKNLLIIPNSQFPIPNSQFPIPNSPFPIPHSQFPILLNYWSKLSNKPKQSKIQEPNHTPWERWVNYINTISSCLMLKS